MSGVIETREALQAISEAEGEIQGIEDEDWKNFPLETEDMSKMEDVEQVNGWGWMFIVFGKQMQLVGTMEQVHWIGLSMICF